MNIQGINIEKLNHASFKIKDSKIVYIDPYQISEAEPADIILITHEHYDHCSLSDIRKIIKDNTIIVATDDCISKLNKFEKNLKIVHPGSSLNIGNIKIEAVPAYNTNKKFHPKENNWVGYIVTINNKRIYHAGDTDFIPEMKQLKNIDIALLPVSGTYVMTAKEAAEACEAIKPKVVIPMHYASIVGTKKDAEDFKRLVKNSKVEIL